MTYAPPARLACAGQDFGVPQTLYVPRFLPRARADALLAWTLRTTAWQHEQFTLFGRRVTAPRLTAWFGEAGAEYRYSGVARRAAPWPAIVQALATQVSEAVASPFNFVLVNRFRSGADMLGWHADDEADLGAAPVIASLSVGAERMFRMRPRHGGTSVGRSLAHGSLVLMWGRSQRDFKHCVPRTAKAVGERLNFTFRLTGAA